MMRPGRGSQSGAAVSIQQCTPGEICPSRCGGSGLKPQAGEYLVEGRNLREGGLLLLPPLELADDHISFVPDPTVRPQPSDMTRRI